MTPHTLIDLMKRDPWSWLWSTGIQVELFPILPRLWDSAEDIERQQLIDLVLEGPPRQQFKDDLDPDEWDWLRDRTIWQRLSRLAQASTALPDAAQVRLDEIEAQYPDWKLTGSDKEDFPFWGESSSGYESDMTAIELAQLAPAELLEALLGGGYYRDGRLSVWEGLVMEEPNRAFPLLDHMVEVQRIDQEILAASFRGLAHSARPTPEMISNVRGVAEKVPYDEWGRGIYPFARTVERLIVKAPAKLNAEVMELWDQAMMPSQGQVSSVEGDHPLTEAINHPVGHLMDALFAVLRSQTQTGDREIPEAIRGRLEFALRPDDVRVSESALRSARIIISSRLSWLHWLDSRWASEHVVPLLDWEHPSAVEAWEGFLWSPKMDPELWTALRSYLLRAFEHYDVIGHRRTKLPELLAQVYVAGYPLSGPEILARLRKVDDAGRNATAHYLDQLLAGAGDKANRLWSDRIGPFFGHAWPKDGDLKNPRLSSHIALAAVHSGDAFPDAVNTIAPLVGPVPYPSNILRDVAASGYPDQFPEATLKLLKSLVEEGAALRHTDLPDILGRIRGKGVELDDNALHRRLKDAAERG